MKAVVRSTLAIAIPISCFLAPLHAQPGAPPITFVIAANAPCKVGRANVKLAESVTWSGRCVDGLATGPGTAQWLESGRPTLRFDGSYVRGLLEGKGKMVGADGDRYEGDYKGGLRHGHGIYVSGRGARFEGEYANNQRGTASAAIVATNPSAPQAHASATPPPAVAAPTRVASDSFRMLRCEGSTATVAAALKEPPGLPREDELVFGNDGAMAAGTDRAKAEAVAKSAAVRLLREALAFADKNRPRDCRIASMPPLIWEVVLVFKDQIPDKVPVVGKDTAATVPGLLAYAEHAFEVWRLYNAGYQREKLDAAKAKEQAGKTAILEFAKKHGLLDKAVKGIYANPFAFEGERLLFPVAFRQMQTATTGLFYLPKEGILMVNDIPKGAFTQEGVVILAAKVMGNVKFDGVVGGSVQVHGMVPNLKFLGALVCRDNQCKQMDEK